MTKEASIFIAHGHNDALKYKVSNFLRKYGIAPVILYEQANNGRTILEKLESEIDKVKYGIILYTADDECKNGQKRARQNVVFEHGLLIGKLGRNKTCIIIDDDVEKPGDIDGLVYISSKNWEHELTKELKSQNLVSI